MKSFRLAALILSLLGGATLTKAQNLPADLDSTFGANGLTAAPSGFAADIVELNGEYVAVGGGQIVKYSSQGALLQQIYATLPNGGSFYNPTAVAAQTDAATGRQYLVVAGFVPKSQNPIARDAVIARYETDLSRDWSFSGGAIQFIVGGNPVNEPTDLAVQPDGKILLVGGTGADVSTERQFVARVDPNGQFDASFGIGGFVETPIGSFSRAASVVYSSRTGIFVGGSSLAAPGGYRDSTVTRYNFDGTLNTAFNTGGIVVLPGGGPASILVNRDFLTIAGVQNLVPNGFGLARLNLQGRLDPRFGSGGYSIRQSPDLFTLLSIARQSDGKIVAAGHSTDLATGRQALLIARYLSDGSPDAEFTSSVSQPLPGTRLLNATRRTSDAGAAVLVNSAERLVVAGSSSSGAQSFLIAQFRGY